MPFKSSGRGAYGPQGQKVIKGPLAPVWVTFSPGSVGTAAFSYTFVATDDSGDVPTYSVASGSLPTGLTLNPTTGVLSGTASASGTFTYTLRATDVNGRSTDTTSISQVVSLSLYTFTSATFGSTSGQGGPDITTARNAVGQPAWTGTYLNMTTTGIQLWTVPGTGNYTIDAYGAAGGQNNAGISYGARTIGTFSLTQGQVLGIVVGQQGNSTGSSVWSSGYYGGAGGGGGSFVWNTSAGNSLLVVASGAGGAHNANTGANGNGIGGSAVGGSAGGNGGQDGLTCQGGAGGSSGSQNYNGGGGGGWGLSYGFAGGNAGSGGNGNGAAGGFGGGGGGGGSACYNLGGGGGGGGYQGGTGSNGNCCGGPNQNCGQAGGGYCYNSGSSVTTQTGARNGNGVVIITRV